MSNTIEIDVTQADIDAGKRGACCDCPIALAATRAFMATMQTGGTYLSRYGYGDPFVSLPAVAQQFVVYFDRGQPVAPFRFTVSVPE